LVFSNLNLIGANRFSVFYRVACSGQKRPTPRPPDTGDLRPAGVVKEDGRAVERGELTADEGVACTEQHRTRTVPAG